MQIKKMMISIYNINLIKNVKLLITKHQQIYFKIIKYLFMQIILKYYIDLYKNYDILYLSDMESNALFLFCCSLLAGATTVLFSEFYDAIFNEELPKVIEKKELYNDIISKDELMKPSDAIEIYNNYNESIDNIISSFIIFTIVCASDLLFIYLTYGSFENYCIRVKQYKKLLNKEPKINE